MAASTLVDAGFLVALLSRRDSHHKWATAQAKEWPFPWRTCEAVLSETFYLLGDASALAGLLERKVLRCDFDFAGEQEPVLALMRKYAQVPMSFADACLVRMTETVAGAMLLTTDADFRIYRRQTRHVIPCITPR
jgi:predicted nucleic acid-binding protein